MCYVKVDPLCHFMVVVDQEECQNFQVKFNIKG